MWKKKLRNQSLQLFEFLPPAIQEQLLLERDPHGNVQVARIETEKMLIQLVETELDSRRKQGLYNKEFKGQSHFFGYEGRCGLPSNFDSNYCYALGYAAGALLQNGKTGLISSVGVMNTHDEETKKFFRHSSVICVLSPRYASGKLSFLKQQIVGASSENETCDLLAAWSARETTIEEDNLNSLFHFETSFYLGGVVSHCKVEVYGFKNL